MTCGCTSIRDYIDNGFKVGPNYCEPTAPVKDQWLDAGHQRVQSSSDDLSRWWSVLNDPQLDQLMVDAYNQNLNLREAGFRILQARAQRQITVGNLFPQQQTANGNYRRFGIGEDFFDQWNFGFNLSWELDFWGRYRRAILSADATLDASIADYDYVCVTLLGDIANNYVSYRTNQERIRLLRRIVKIQEDVLEFIEQRLKAGAVGVTDLDRAQARSNVRQTESQIDLLDIEVRQAQNRLCILMGMPVYDLSQMLNADPNATIPVSPEFVAVGIPADLLRRRPDVRRAERIAAAQAELIGIAEADLYPAFSINGTLGWQAAQFSDLFRPQALNSSVGPSFNWNILNYGRIRNNVRLQDARFQELVTTYQNSVLQADLEVENSIITFVKAHDRERKLRDSVDNAYIALQVVVAQYEAGLAGVDFNRYATIVQSLVQQQDLWVQSRGQIVQGLIETYRALGGGWQTGLSESPEQDGSFTPASEATPEQPVPIPAPAGELPPAPENPTDNALLESPTKVYELELARKPGVIVETNREGAGAQ